MPIAQHLTFTSIGSLALVAAMGLLAGCQSTPEQSAAVKAAPVATPAPAVVVATPATAPTPAPAVATAWKPLRIKVGPGAAFKDAEGNGWVVETGFTDGETVERPDLQIGNTKTPAIYWSERYSMTAFSLPVPNGKYTVKLHFAETFEGIEGAGQRVFSFKVEDREFKDFDVFVKAGGPLRAYVETVTVEVTDGKLDVKFTPNVENPQINGIEILPGS